MVRPTTLALDSNNRVRTRRAYFDCRFGQLHVRTAFPTTGGFDEGAPLLCLHPMGSSGRVFEHFLAEIADDRSVYAPDLPGCGESDPAPTADARDAAAAVVDFAADLRLRQVDVLGFRFGAEVALELAVSHPALVRRLVLVAAPSLAALPVVEKDSLVLRIDANGPDGAVGSRGGLIRARFVDLKDYVDDLFDAAPKTLSKQIGDFLRAKS